MTNREAKAPEVKNTCEWCIFFRENEGGRCGYNNTAIRCTAEGCERRIYFI